MRGKLYHICKSAFGGCISTLSYPLRNITNKKVATIQLNKLRKMNNSNRIIYWIGWNWK